MTTPLAAVLALAVAASAQDVPGAPASVETLRARAAAAFQTGKPVDGVVSEQELEAAFAVVKATAAPGSALAKAADELKEGLPLAFNLQVKAAPNPVTKQRVDEVKRAAKLLGADEGVCLCLYARGGCSGALTAVRDRRDAEQRKDEGGARVNSWISRKDSLFTNRSVEGLPDGQAGAEKPSGGGRAPDFRALNAAPSGLPNTVKTGSVADPISEREKMERAFQASVKRMTDQGLRSGDGEMGGVANNMKASLMPGSKNLRCYDQAEQLVGDLEKAGIGSTSDPKAKYKLVMRSYTGEGHEANGHWWVEAVPKDPKDQTIVMDPWKNSIKTLPVGTRTETVIKSYPSYLMGWWMNGGPFGD